MSDIFKKAGAGGRAGLFAPKVKSAAPPQPEGGDKEPRVLSDAKPQRDPPQDITDGFSGRKNPSESDVGGKTDGKITPVEKPPYIMPDSPDITGQIRAFSEWLVRNPIDATAQALWMHLMVMWSESGMPEWFEVANATLMSLLNVTDKSLLKYRNVLVDAERIEYQGTERKKKGNYKIHLFNLPEPPNGNSAVYFPPVSDSDGKTDRENTPDGKTGVNLDGNSPLDLLAYLKRKIDGLIDGGMDMHAGEAPSAMQVFEQNFAKLFGMPMNPFHYEMLRDYLADGLTIEVMLAALEDAENFGAKQPKYLWRIFGTLTISGVKTVSDYRAYLEAQAGQREMAPGANQLRLVEGTRSRQSGKQASSLNKLDELEANLREQG